MAKSRSEYVLKNATISLVMQLIKNVLAFAGRTVFIYVLGAEYLGVNSLFTDVLTVLSFAELGIGNAMIFSLYKPIAEQDTNKIKSLMRLYAKSYRIIGVVIAVLGVLLIPFLKFLVNDVDYVQENITLLYVLFLLNSVISYFFVYKKSLIIADQKNYIVEIYQQVFYGLQIVVQSVFLIVTKAFIPYLLIMIAFTFLNNYFVARKADKMYPYLKEKHIEPLKKEEFHGIVTNIKALVVYKVGGIILESTDSIFISILINVVTVGLYANYKMVVNVFKTIGNQVMNSIVASVGNLNASSTDERKEKVFYEMLYISTWFYGFTAVGLCIFMTPLIKIWFGDSYVIGFDAVIAACIYFYVSNMHYPCYTYRTTAGLFVFGKYVPLISAFLNIILDIIMGSLWGLSGILWASIISRILTYELIDPILVYKRVFHKNALKYFAVYLVMTAVVAADGFVSFKLASLITVSGFPGLLLQVVIMSIAFNVIFAVLTFKSAQMQSILGRIRTILKKRKEN